jgi:hypothetical protein
VCLSALIATEITRHSTIRWLASMADESDDKEMTQQTDQLMLK